jgi:4'-phosphopantetheinyl transferase
VNETLIWLAHLDSLSAAQLSDLAALLDPVELARAARFHFESDRNRYVACRGLLRRLLSDLLNAPCSEVVIEYGRHGKPMLGDRSGTRRPHFNMSHSDNRALFVLAWEREVGIDLESALRLPNDETKLSALAERILSQREFLVWQSLPDSAARHAGFLRAWTRKEALAKATGQGVFADWSRFELALDALSPDPALAICLPGGENEAATAWLLHDLAAPEGFAAAVAIEQKMSEIDLKTRRGVACGL